MADLNAFERYLLALRKTPLDEKTEHTDRVALETLLQTFADDASGGFKVQHEPKRVADKGAPDFKVTKTRPDPRLCREQGDRREPRQGAEVGADQRNTRRFRRTSSSPTICISSGSTRTAIQRETLCHVTDLENPKFRLTRGSRRGRHASSFKASSRPRPKASAARSSLALALATRSQLLRDYLGEELVRQETGTCEGRLYGLFQIFRDQVFHELTLEGIRRRLRADAGLRPVSGAAQFGFETDHAAQCAGIRAGLVPADSRTGRFPERT